MSIQKSKSIHNLEERMEKLDPESFRYKVLDAAKSFKSSWIEMGQYLFTIYKDKMYKDWGYLTFEAYCAKEIGIRQVTALKMLKSYSFLEHEEPNYLKQESFEEKKPHQIPSFESVNALRLAKASDRIPQKDYETLREDVLDNAKEDGEVKKKIRYILKSNAPKNTGEEKEDRKVVLVKKLVNNLENTRNELSQLELPNKVLKKIDELLEILADFN